MITTTDIVEQYYLQLQNISLNCSQKAELFYNIVFIKNGEGSEEIYVDIKNFIKNYFESIDEKKYGYDNLKISKIKGCIALLKLEQRLSIYLFLKKLCLKNNYKEEWEELKNDFYESKILLLKNNNVRWYFNPITIFKILYFKSLYSYLYLCLLVIFFVLIDFLILLPNSWDLWPSLFEIKYERISSDFIINHFSNLLLNIFEIESEFKLIPLNFLGVFLLLLGKTFKIVFVIKYAADKFLKKMSLDE